MWIKRVEPSHIIILGLVVAAVGVGWQLYRGTPQTSSQKVTLIATKIPGPPPPPPLSEEGRRFREELRKFVLSDVASAFEIFSGYASQAANKFMDTTRNSRTISPSDREKNESIYQLYMNTRISYEVVVRPLLESANRPVESIDFNEIGKNLKVFTAGYREETISLSRFLIPTHAETNADSLEQWKNADERAAYAFRNLQSFPETSSIIQQWMSNGFFESRYPWFKQRMRYLESLDGK